MNHFGAWIFVLILLVGGPATLQYCSPDERVVAKDSVLPLSDPITTASGKLITEIPVRKGQHLVIAISSYHRYADVTSCEGSAE